jgi:hypothetical protein
MQQQEKQMQQQEKQMQQQEKQMQQQDEQEQSAGSGRLDPRRQLNQGDF